MTIAPLVVHHDAALRNGNRSRKMVERSQVRLNQDLVESRRGRFYSGHRVEKVEVRMGAPGVTVGPHGLRFLCPGGQAEIEHLPPRPQQAEISIAQSDSFNGTEQVEPKVV